MMVKGLSNIQHPNKFCKSYVLSKYHKKKIDNKIDWKATKLLRLVHIDVCDPLNRKSNRGKRYSLTFSYDYTRRTWMYYLKRKIEVFDNFKEFKAFVENRVAIKLECFDHINMVNIQ